MPCKDTACPYSSIFKCRRTYDVYNISLGLIYYSLFGEETINLHINDSLILLHIKDFKDLLFMSNKVTHYLLLDFSIFNQLEIYEKKNL